MSTAATSDKPVIIWLLTGCFLVFVMVLVGGITRLTDSGLSMVDWNLVMGAIPPLSEAEWQASFDAYKQFPEFQAYNQHFTLEDYKSIFFWEYLHRMIGRFIGIVFIVPFLWFLIKKRIDRALLPKLLILFAMGGFQGFLGWFMVKSGLANDPDVSHYRLAMHLTTAFLTFGYTLWLVLELVFKGSKTDTSQPRLYTWAVALFAVVMVQIVYGAFVAGLKAGLVFNTWPKMGEWWFPDALTVLDPTWVNFVEGLPGVQFVHRMVAYAVVALVGVLWWKARNLPLAWSQRIAVNGLLVVVIAQFALGVMTLLMRVPLTLGLLHQIGAFVLMAFSILAIHRFKKVTVAAVPDQTQPKEAARTAESVAEA